MCLFEYFWELLYLYSTLSSLFRNPEKALFIRSLPAKINFFRQKNLMIWQIFYQITQLLSKNKCIEHFIFF
jgi:hypothetical protein